MLEEEKVEKSAYNFKKALLNVSRIKPKFNSGYIPSIADLNALGVHELSTIFITKVHYSLVAKNIVRLVFEFSSGAICPPAASY